MAEYKVALEQARKIIATVPSETHAVLAAAHNKICHHSAFAVGAAAQQDAPAGIAVVCKQVLYVHQYHGKNPPLR